MYERPHHQRIARVLNALNGPLLREHSCLLGGGTLIAMRFGEYRESLDVDFLVSEIGHYRQLRHARDLARAIDRMQARTGWLERCMKLIGMADAKAVVWQRIRALRRVL